MNKTNEVREKFVFSNEALYEKNIFGIVYPEFFRAQMEKNIEKAILSVKIYWLFTQHFYREKSKGIEDRLRKIQLIRNPKTYKELQYSELLNNKAWVEVERIFCDVSNELDKKDMFKRGYKVVADKPEDESALL